MTLKNEPQMDDDGSLSLKHLAGFHAGTAHCLNEQIQGGALVTLPKHGLFAPWFLNRDVASTHWDHQQQVFTRDAVLQLVEFLEWTSDTNETDIYVRVVVISWPSNPGLAGKHALVALRFVQINTPAGDTKCGTSEPKDKGLSATLH